MTLVLALPSKGRLKEQAESWLAACGLKLETNGGARGYQASLIGMAGVDVRLNSAAEIAAGLAAGEFHLGVTGDDLLGETAGALLPLLALGFGRADLVVAAPRAWIDVQTMTDIDEVAHDILARTGRRMRVATKYARQTRTFFAAHGVADYRIVESAGATEGAPAAGAAEVIVDITTTGATLAANGLKVLADGLILQSQARLAAALDATWDEEALTAARRLLSVFEASAKARSTLRLAWPVEQDAAARKAVGKSAGAVREAGLVARSELFAVADRLAAAGVGPVSVEQPAYVFEARCEAADRLLEALGAQSPSRTSP